MTGYASNTGTLRNLSALRENGWRLLLTPSNPTVRQGLRFGIDNDAWRAHQQGIPFAADPFKRLIEKCGALADFVIIPDIVAGGLRSFEFSQSWLPYLRTLNRLLLPLQDGMTPEIVGPFLHSHPNVGLFLGGSTEFKLREIYAWGMVAHAFGRHYHVGRVNTARRIRLCAEAGADSFDGTSATMFSCTLPLLESARKQPSLLTPERCHA